MRCVTAVLMAAILLVAPTSAAPPAGNPASAEAILGWINSYRLRPEPARVPEAVRAMSRVGALKDPESAGVYVGFIAGVLNANPAEAERLVARMLPLPPEDQWALVRAIAYSGLPQWKGLLHGFAMHMPGRKPMIDRYLAGKLPTLDQIAIKKQELGFLARLRGSPLNAAPVLEPSPDLIDTLWGFYFGVGAYEPIARIVAMLPWSNDDNDAERLTLGGMAKYTLASNAARDHELLRMLKWAVNHQPDDIKLVLTEVIEAAETADTAKIRRQALAAIEDLKRKGPGYKRRIATWGQLGQGALALGCIGAAAAGAVTLGLPCVIGGAVSSAAINYLTTRD